jgi:hypothetical protein
MYISRDPFARTELHKTAVKTTLTCDWCGQKRKDGKLYQYRNESDGGRTGYIPGLFCSISCMRSYHL